MPYYGYDHDTEELMNKYSELVHLIEEHELKLFRDFVKSKSNPVQYARDLFFPQRKMMHVIKNTCITELGPSFTIQILPFISKKAIEIQTLFYSFIEDRLRNKEIVPQKKKASNKSLEIYVASIDVIKLMVRYKIFPYEILYIDHFYPFLQEYRQQKLEELKASSLTSEAMLLYELVSFASGHYFSKDELSFGEWVLNNLSLKNNIMTHRIESTSYGKVGNIGNQVLPPEEIEARKRWNDLMDKTRNAIKLGKIKAENATKINALVEVSSFFSWYESAFNVNMISKCKHLKDRDMQKLSGKVIRDIYLKVTDRQWDAIFANRQSNGLSDFLCEGNKVSQNRYCQKCLELWLIETGLYKKNELIKQTNTYHSSC